MKIIIFILVTSILHVVVVAGLLLAWFGIISFELIKYFLIAFGILILIDVIYGLYYLISKPAKKEGHGYHKLKIEEADKQEAKK